MWERCRPPMAIVIIGTKGDKEGQTSGWNKSGLNNKCKSISWLSDCYHLFKDKGSPSFGAYAPPSPDLTFYAYALLRRVGRLPATFQILSDDLSRHCEPLSPKGKAFYPGICVSLSPKGKAFYSGICAPLSPKGKAFLYIMLIHILFCFVLFCYTFYGYRYMDIDCAVI